MQNKSALNFLFLFLIKRSNPMNNNIIADFPFHHNIHTHWKDVDSFGHINHAVFLTYIEDARIIFFKWWKIAKQNKSLIVASVKIYIFSIR